MRPWFSSQKLGARTLGLTELITARSDDPKRNDHVMAQEGKSYSYYATDGDRIKDATSSARNSCISSQSDRTTNMLESIAIINNSM